MGHERTVRRRIVKRGEEPHLVLLTKSVNPPPELPADKILEHRLNRWKLQSIAREILPQERVSTCCRRMVPGRSVVEIWKAKEKAHYSGLRVCASVWVCPVCAAKISERRREELVRGIEAWKAIGGQVIMLTQTVPHYQHQPLNWVLSRFSKARKLLRNRKPWKRIAAGIGLAGSVRALEVTYGENGWHVHVHELLFLRPGVQVDLVVLESDVLEQWKKACIGAGLSEPNHHGVKVDNGAQAAKYASKWGMEDELTKAHIKKGREGHLTPWDFLRQVDEGDMEGVGLFVEYAKAFKGKRQLTWSEGLRDLLGLAKEETDEEVAARVEEDAVLLGLLTREHWQLVLRADKRGELLEVAAAYGWDGVVGFIRELVRVGYGDAPF